MGGVGVEISCNAHNLVCGLLVRQVGGWNNARMLTDVIVIVVEELWRVWDAFFLCSLKNCFRVFDT